MPPSSSKVISDDPPNSLEQRHNESLVAWCATRQEPLEESKRRQHVLQRLDTITKMWVRSIMINEYRMPSHEAEQYDSRIFATGSYRYNVHSSGSDIDLVLITPEKITRSHFFGSLVERLSDESWIRNIIPTTEAIVPIIAMECDGIDIDLSFGAIKRSKVPEKLDDDLIRGLDDTAMRSCNAVRVAQLVIDLVPDINAFRQALRFVKAWAKSRGIYSSKFGFPTGIGWAILTAFVCQCYPKQNPAGIVFRFFQTYTQWFKPDKTNAAIFLTEAFVPRNPIGKTWDPRRDKRDARALLPVLTPANPYSNSCHNITRTTLRIMCDEFRRGHDMLKAALSRPPNSELQWGVWGEVLASSRELFLRSHKHYLHVQVSTTTAASYQRYVEAVEAKIRFLWEEVRHNAGRALECFGSVRTHVWSARFEDPEEVAEMRRLLAEDKARTAKNASAATAAPGVSAASSNAAAAAAGGGGCTNNGGTATQKAASSMKEFTAHYFFGLELVQAPPPPPATGAAGGTTAPAQPQPQQQQLDLNGVAKAFRELVQQQKEFVEGVTMLPRITVVSQAKLPSWLLPPKREREADGDAPSGSSHPPAPHPPSDASAAPPPASTAAATAAAVKEALGLDF